MNSDGRLDVFAVAEGGILYHRWQTTPGGDWTASWTSLGSPPGLTLNDTLAVGNNADGRLAVFALANNNELYHIWQITLGDLSN
jgi:hypothetical protein